MRLNSGPYPTGFLGHAIYLNIERRTLGDQDYLLLRVDNLDGIEDLSAAESRMIVKVR